MQYIAFISYGKDSLAQLEVIRIHNLPLDRIVHVEIMATETIPAELPEMVSFKKNADLIIKERYGIEVEHFCATKSYNDWFYSVRGEKANPKNVGKIYGFPMMRGNWCNSKLKMQPINKFNRKDIVQYIGIAADEPNRFKILNERKRSVLVEYGITEKEARKICEDLDLLSPIYTNSTRGGCWFCHNQRLDQLRYLRMNYPEYWDLMLKWDLDSPVTFKPNGVTLHDLDKRFENEGIQVKWSDCK